MQSECKIQPSAGPSQEGMIATAHNFKRDWRGHVMPSPNTSRTTSKIDMPWRYIVVGGRLVPFRCPTCDTEIRLLATHDTTLQQTDAITCSRCGWIPANLTPAQKAALRTDPELVPAKEYMERTEYKYNQRNIKGKTKRDKKFLSKACY